MQSPVALLHLHRRVGETGAGEETSRAHPETGRGAVQDRSSAPVSMGIAASVGRDSQAAAVCPSWATGHRPEGEPDAKRAPGSGRGDLLGVSPYLAQMSVVPFSRPKTLGFSSFSYNDVQCFTILKMKAQFISLRNT